MSQKHNTPGPEQLLLFPETESEYSLKHRIEKILESELSAPVEISLTRNRSVLLSIQRRRGKVQVRMHQAFLQADRRVISAVADLIKKKSPRLARAIINDYIRNKRSIMDTKKRARALFLNPKGRVYDLGQVLKQVAEKYNLPLRGIKITWGNARIRKGQQSIRLGSFYQDEKLIRVHPRLDHEEVPRYFVDYIVFHELLHAAVPPQEKRGRRNYHTDDYHEQEEKFERYEEARKYEKFLLSHWLH
jgi:predicted metal-dependent hydrolase